MLTLKIKIKYHSNDIPKLHFISKGEWVDLYSAENIEFMEPKATKLKRVRNVEEPYSYRPVIYDTGLISVGVSVKLPKGIEANIAPRSSTYKNYGILQTNSIGIIDSSYSGTNDIWKMPYIAMKEGKIQVGDRPCQFRLQLSQKATMWQKIKWLLTSKIVFEEVDKLDDEDRGGFGTTNK